jgi:hypothetical protein
MNRIDPDLFAACFMDWVRASWSAPIEAIAIDGKTASRSYDRAKGQSALHLVSAFATRSRLVLGQEAVDDNSNETTAIPALLEKLAAGGRPGKRRGHHRRHRPQSSDRWAHSGCRGGLSARRQRQLVSCPANSFT